MQTRKDYEKEKARLSKLLSEVNKKLTEYDSKTLVQCTNNNNGKGCGMGHEIRNLDYIQTHWYESPYGCTGGDMWHQGEGNFICPHCEHRNRLYDRKEIEDLKYLFNSILDEHER